MILSGISVVILIIMLIAREFDLGGPSSNSPYNPIPSAPTVYKGSLEMTKSTKTPSSGRTSSIHIEHNDLSRLIRHMNGEFVYPSPGSQVHRRNKSSKESVWTKNSDVRSVSSSATLLEPVNECPS
jgi:hypothetical protein